MKRGLLEPKHDCQLVDISVIMFGLFASSNTMFSPDLWWFCIADFTMGMLQFMFGLFSPLSLETIFWNYKKEKIIICCRKNEEIWGRVLTRHKPFSSPHITVLNSYHHPMALWRTSSLFPQLWAHRSLKTKIFSQCRSFKVKRSWKSGHSSQGQSLSFVF